MAGGGPETINREVRKLRSKFDMSIHLSGKIILGFGGTVGIVQ